MLKLAQGQDVAGDTQAASRYRQYGLAVLATLRSTEFLAIDTPGWQAIVRHATYHHDTKLAIDESVMWGDYYFIEALDIASRLGSAAASGSTASPDRSA
jgi:unsaturated chondroitin disaccharide hydrolase